jgi:23S rRNA (guanosine2251-2'-O)-methyltransferase
VEDILSSAQEKGHDAFVVLLDGIEDPHNLGAIIRTCECAGVDGIIIPKIRACQVNETVVRTSAGAISNMKIARVTNLKEAIDTLKDNGLWIYVSETGGEDIYSQNLTGPIGIVIGSEGNGVKQSLRSYCDGIITLPLKGSVNSLNASVANAIVVYEVLRQRESKKQ